MRKLANFTTDSVVFSIKEPFLEAKVNIKQLAQAFPKERAFTFSVPEIALYE